MTRVDANLDADNREAKLSIIDLYAALDGKPELFPDRVHPNDDGAKLIAKTVYEALKK